MARELSRPLRLFIASQPTRGVDVGSIEFLHKRIVAERDHGTPVMIVSTELDEVIELADRIAVLYKGRLVGIVPAGTGRDVLGLMMAGVSLDEAQADAAGKHSAQSLSDNAAPNTAENPAGNTAENPADNPATTPATSQAPAAPSVQEPGSGAVGDPHE
jgi:simple sugar transport system ATP-binding protein